MYLTCCQKSKIFFLGIRLLFAWCFVNTVNMDILLFSNTFHILLHSIQFRIQPLTVIKEVSRTPLPSAIGWTNNSPTQNTCHWLRQYCCQSVLIAPTGIGETFFFNLKNINNYYFLKILTITPILKSFKMYFCGMSYTVYLCTEIGDSSLIVTSHLNSKQCF